MDADNRVIKPEIALNIAFTAAGLDKLGLKRTSLDTFPQEFREGMAKQPRPRRMGDIGASDPQHWEFASQPPGEEIHALLIVQAPEAEGQSKADLIQRLAEEHAERLRGYGIREVVLPRHVACQDSTSKEHFGFRDAISQPDIEGSPNRNPTNQACVKAGEFILGYKNEYGVLPQSPIVGEADDPSRHLSPHARDPQVGAVKDLGRNGSYLVFRKLAQDVAAFRRFLRDNSTGREEEARLGAKLVGRWPGGAPLALADHDDPQLATANEFGYAKEDPHGHRCPVASHIRRTNPRDALLGNPQDSQTIVNRHRILRRGVLYGDRLPEGTFDDDGKPRGLLFLCINADIERQFEFVQQTWIISQKFGGLYTDGDPVMGANADPQNPRDTGPWTMTIPASDARRRLSELPRFVTMRGGAYFFLPSISALRFLSEMRV